MNWFLTLKKSILGLLTGLAASIVFGIVQAITSYNPVICSSTVTENCTPQFVSTAYYAIIPVVTAFLVCTVVLQFLESLFFGEIFFIKHIICVRRSFRDVRQQYKIKKRERISLFCFYAQGFTD